MNVNAPDPIDVGARIRELRDLRNISQPELAKQIDVSTGSIWRWEKGDRLPSSEDLASLSRFFGVPMEQLLFGGPSSMPLSKSLRTYFESQDGSRLETGQKLALSELIGSREPDDASIRVAVKLLLMDPAK